MSSLRIGYSRVTALGQTEDEGDEVLAADYSSLTYLSEKDTTPGNTGVTLVIDGARCGDTALSGCFEQRRLYLIGHIDGHEEVEASPQGSGDKVPPQRRCTPGRRVRAHEVALVCRIGGREYGSWASAPVFEFSFILSLGGGRQSSNF